MSTDLTSAFTIPPATLLNPSQGNFELMFTESLGEKIDGLHLLSQQVTLVTSLQVTRLKADSSFEIQFQVDDDHLVLQQLQSLMRVRFFDVLISMLNSQGKIVSVHRAKDVALRALFLPTLDVLHHFGMQTGRQIVTAAFDASHVTVTNVSANAS